MSSPIPHYRLKVERAKTHIEALQVEIKAFIDRKPYDIVVENNDARGQKVWKLRVRECVPETWGTLVGDAIHNIRASLDTLLCSVVRHCDPQRSSLTHVHFVIRETREEFEVALPKNAKGASPEAIQILHDLKPYKGGNEPLWRLHRLDILDKHQAIVPVGAAHQYVDIAPMINASLAHMVRGMGHPFDELPQLPGIALRPADRQFPLQDGAELFAAPIAGDPTIKDDEVKFSIEIAFGEGQIVDGEPVIPALLQLANVVEGIFDIFEQRILMTPKA